MNHKLDISFRPVTTNDLPILGEWLNYEHWRRYWGNPDEELELIRQMVAGHDTTRPFMFSVDGQVMGYIQYWFVGHHQNRSWVNKYPWLQALPSEAVGIDLSIGKSKYLSKGIGTQTLNQFIERLSQLGYTNFVIDPDPQNKRAIRAYEKAGFSPITSLQDKNEDVLLMQYTIH